MPGKFHGRPWALWAALGDGWRDTGLLQAAIHLDCDLDELDNVPAFWRDLALLSLGVEAELRDPDLQAALDSLKDDNED